MKTDLNSFYQKLFAYLKMYLNFENSTIYYQLKNTRKLIELASTTERVDMISNISFKFGNGLSAWNFSKKKVLLLNNIQYEYYVSKKQMHSFMSIPLISHRKVVGIINFSHSEPYAFDEISINSLKKVLPIISSIIDGKMLGISV